MPDDQYSTAALLMVRAGTARGGDVSPAPGDARGQGKEVRFRAGMRVMLDGQDGTERRAVAFWKNGEVARFTLIA